MKTLKPPLILVALVFVCSNLAAETIWIAATGGVYRSVLDEESGELSEPILAGEFPSGSFLAIHPELDVIYASYREKARVGYTSLLLTDSPENLVIQSTQLLASDYGAPTHLAVSGNGRFLAGAHYGGQANFVYRLNLDGSISAEVAVLPQKGSGPGRTQGQARPHWIGFDSRDAFMHSVDLGSDEVWTYAVGDSAKDVALSHKVKLPIGTGPRHMAFHPKLGYAYVCGELNLHVNSFHYDRDSGRLSPVQYIPTVEAPAETGLTTLSEIQVHKNGRFVYAAVRGLNLISVFEIEPKSGELSLVERTSTNVDWPRNFTISQSGNWLIVAGQRSHEVRVFSLDSKTGKLSATESRIELQNPVCVRAWGRM